jgi:hypothetical protein
MRVHGCCKVSDSLNLSLKSAIVSDCFTDYIQGKIIKK